MRRFFISGFERLLSVLTILSVLAVAALAARIAVEAQPGDTRAYLTAAAVLVGGWLAVVACAGVSFLAIAMHDNSRRLIGLMAQGSKGARPLTATRQPERAVAKPRHTPIPVPDHDLWDDEDDLIDEPVATAPQPSRRNSPHPTPAPKPQHGRQNGPQQAEAHQPPARSVFTGRAMPRISADHATDHHADKDAASVQTPVAAPHAEKAPVEPAPAPLTSPSNGASRLVAERRFPR